jgi:hypothetical protein
MIARAFGAGTTLLLLVLVLFVVARTIGGRGPGVLSPRQQRRAAKRSADDAARLAALAHARRRAEQAPVLQPWERDTHLDLGRADPGQPDLGQHGDGPHGSDDKTP